MSFHSQTTHSTSLCRAKVTDWTRLLNAHPYISFIALCQECGSGSVALSVSVFYKDDQVCMDNQELQTEVLAGRRLHMRRADTACALTRWQHFCTKLRHCHHTKTVTSNGKSDSVNQCIFTSRTILLNFIPIEYETIEL